MKPKTFEEYLQEYFAESIDGVRFVADDDMPDAFDHWLGELSADEFIAYADRALKEQADRMKV